MNDPNETETTRKELLGYFENRIQLDYTNPPASGLYWNANPAVAWTVAQQIMWDRMIDQWSGLEPPCTLGSALTKGTTYNSITVGPSPVSTWGDLKVGQVLNIVQGASIQTVTVRAACAWGSSTILVNSFKANGNYGASSNGTWNSAVGQVIPTNGWPLQCRFISQSPVPSGVIKINGNFPRSQFQTIADICQQLGLGDWGIGFDYDLRAHWLDSKPGGTPVAWIEFWWPNRGTKATGPGQPGHHIDLSKAIDWSWDEDGTQQATEVYGIAQTGSFIQSIQKAANVLDAGWPALESVVSHLQINDPTHLAAATRGELAAYEWPVASPVVTLEAFPLDGVSTMDVTLNPPIASAPVPRPPM